MSFELGFGNILKYAETLEKVRARTFKGQSHNWWVVSYKANYENVKEIIFL